MQAEIPADWGSVCKQLDHRRAAGGGGAGCSQPSADGRPTKRRCTSASLVVDDEPPCASSTGANTATAASTPLRDEVLRNIASCGDRAPTVRETLEVDSLICRLPYKKMLTSLCNRDGATRAADIQYVTRAYEESYMHEPMGKDQRECAKGKACECMFIDPSNAFVCVEFLLPGERPSPTPQMCVLCCRATTQQLYYDMMFDRQDYGTVIQRYGNLHSQEGEYALDAMLMASPSAPVHLLPLPIVAHQRNRYSVVSKRGIRYLKQHRVLFQDTPSCTADSGCT